MVPRKRCLLLCLPLYSLRSAPLGNLPTLIRLTSRLRIRRVGTHDLTPLINLIGQVFQVLLLDSENTGAESGSSFSTLGIEQFDAFLSRHTSQKSIVPGDNEAMKDSYLNLDEQMRLAVHMIDTLLKLTVVFWVRFELSI